MIIFLIIFCRAKVAKIGNDLDKSDDVRKNGDSIAAKIMNSSIQ